jgi:putative membrane protein
VTTSSHDGSGERTSLDLGRAPSPARVFATGIVMGAADVVPGFSGGTVALVGGIYPRLVRSIRANAHVLSVVLRLRWRELPAAIRSVEWRFVAALLAGIMLAVFSFASALERLLETQPIVMSALFLGLVLGAAVVARRELHAPDGRLVPLGIVSAIGTFLVLGASPGTLVAPSPLVIAVGGAIAVCATVLPGVSGSFLLLLLGLYAPIIAAVSARDLVTLGFLGGGILVGLMSFSTLLHWLLARHHDRVLAVLIGLMVGSVRVLWPWPVGTGVGDPALGAPDAQVLSATLTGLAAFAVVIAVGALVDRSGAGRRGAATH